MASSKKKSVLARKKLAKQKAKDKRAQKKYAKAVRKSERGMKKLYRTAKKKVKARERRAKILAGHVDILRDTGVLFKALDVGAAGNLFILMDKGVRVGFGGVAKHPDGKATIADIARFHNAGKGRLPKRQIIFLPDVETQLGMLKDLRAGVKKLMKGGGGK